MDKTFVGPGLGLTDANSAIVSPGGNPGIALSADGSNTISLTFDGIIVRNMTGTNNSGFKISGGDATKTKIRILRSAIKGGQDIGVNIQSNTTLIMDQDIVDSNQQGGIFLSSSNFTITNSLIQNNGTGGTGGGASTFGGITVGMLATAKTLYNLTVVNNHENDNAILGAGVSCALNTIVGNTVLWGNLPSDISQCTNNNTAYLGATGAGNISLSSCAVTDIFMSATDFRPQKTPTMAGCSLVDKGTTPTGVPAHDLNGVSRPQGAAWDIGAYEAQ
jgi:hypothetical protein